MIVITGAAGFIGSCLAAALNAAGYYDLVLVDDFTHQAKEHNYIQKSYTKLVHRNEFFTWLDAHEHLVQFIFHIGARTDTAEFDVALLTELNLAYTKQVWQKCIKYGLPLVYASSAATYGDGQLGYNDDHNLSDKLQPLNPYGISKNEFDKWALKQDTQPYFWAGLKFFNVYGPNEYHKARMASVIFHTFNQVREHGQMKLFRSHRIDFKDGEQMRDFVYVKDVCEVLMFLMEHRKHSGIYNLGSGVARTFNDLTTAVFKELNISPNIEYIDTPIDIRDKYQYFTEANMNKLKGIGYAKPFTSLEDGIKEYVNSYLVSNKYY
jgi:ADP-L-glycero-D-manno-heptose 6-epimerase